MVSFRLPHPALLLSKPPSSERGPGRQPRNRLQKALSSGDLHQRKSRSHGEGEFAMDAGGPCGTPAAAQAELGARLEGE